MHNSWQHNSYAINSQYCNCKVPEGSQRRSRDPVNGPYPGRMNPVHTLRIYSILLLLSRTRSVYCELQLCKGSQDTFTSRIKIHSLRFKARGGTGFSEPKKAPGHNWLKYHTSGKVEGSIPDQVNWFFNLPNPSGRTMALGSTQPLTQTSTRNLPGGEGRPAR
jgi:hypothetical protein